MSSFDPKTSTVKNLIDQRINGLDQANFTGFYNKNKDLLLDNLQQIGLIISHKDFEGRGPSVASTPQRIKQVWQSPFDTQETDRLSSRAYSQNESSHRPYNEQPSWINQTVMNESHTRMRPSSPIQVRSSVDCVN